MPQQILTVDCNQLAGRRAPRAQSLPSVSVSSCPMSPTTQRCQDSPKYSRKSMLMMCSKNIKEIVIRGWRLPVVVIAGLIVAKKAGLLCGNAVTWLSRAD
jgi:hypothetical protein